jgi:hypothetical protein
MESTEEKKKRRLARLKAEADSAKNPFNGGTMGERMKKQQAYADVIRKMKEEEMLK